MRLHGTKKNTQVGLQQDITARRSPTVCCCSCRDRPHRRKQAPSRRGESATANLCLIIVSTPPYVLTRDCGQFSNGPDERQVIAFVCPVGGRPATSYILYTYIYPSASTHVRWMTGTDGLTSAYYEFVCVCACQREREREALNAKQ